MAVAFTQHSFAPQSIVANTDDPLIDFGRRGPSGFLGRMSGTKRTAGIRRRHGFTVPFDRDQLERSGWRTTLDYQENHTRRRDGRLDQLQAVWRATGERLEPDGAVLVVTASAHTGAEAWAKLRHEADLSGCVGRSKRGAEGRQK